MKRLLSMLLCLMLFLSLGAVEVLALPDTQESKEVSAADLEKAKKQAETEPASVVGVVNCKGLNVREDMSEEAEKKGLLKEGTVVTIEYFIEGGWYRIINDEGIGYVKAEFLDVGNPPEEISALAMELIQKAEKEAEEAREQQFGAHVVTEIGQISDVDEEEAPKEETPAKATTDKTAPAKDTTAKNDTAKEASSKASEAEEAPAKSDAAEQTPVKSSVVSETKSETEAPVSSAVETSGSDKTSATVYAPSADKAAEKKTAKDSSKAAAEEAQAADQSAKETAPQTEESAEENKIKEDNELLKTYWTNKVVNKKKDYLHIRKQPSSRYEAVGMMAPGTAGQIISKASKWTKIRSGDCEGYVLTDFLAFDDEAEEIYMEEVGITGKVNCRGLNLRKGASEESEKIYLLKKDATVDVEFLVDDNWYRITSSGYRGFVKSEYIDLDGVHEAITMEEYEKKMEAAGLARLRGEYVVECTDHERDMLAAIIYCEAGCESAEGKLAVGAVVINRVKCSYLPNTIAKVILQANQFTPVGSGSFGRCLKRGAPEDCYEAADRALRGESNVGDRLSFRAGKKPKKRKNAIQIDHQYFF